METCEKLYTHTVTSGSYVPTIGKKKPTSTPAGKQYTCYTCSKAVPISEHGFRVGDQVSHRKTKETGTVVWVSDCKTHVRVRCNGIKETPDVSSCTGADIYVFSNGVYVLQKGIYNGLRKEGRLIEHAGNYVHIGPDISVNTTRIMSQRIDKETYALTHPPKYVVKEGTQGSILQHGGNEGSARNQARVYVVDRPGLRPDSAAAGKRPPVYTQGKKRIGPRYDHGNILEHTIADHKPDTVAPKIGYMQSTQSSVLKTSRPGSSAGSGRLDPQQYGAVSSRNSSSNTNTPGSSTARSGSTTERGSQTSRLGSETSRETPRVNTARPVVDNWVPR